MSDLAGMFNPLSSYSGGQQIIQDRLKNQSLDLANQTSQAALPGVMGQSQSLQAKGQYDQTMLPSHIQQGQSDAATKIDKNDVEQMNNFGNRLSTFGSLLQNVPPVARQVQLSELAKKYGIDPKHAIMSPFMQADPNQLPELLQKTGSTIAMSAGDFQQKRAIEQDRTNALVENNKATNQSRENVANTQAQARVQAAEQKAKQAASMLKPDQKIVYLNSIPEDQRTPDEQAELRHLLDIQLSSRIAGTPDLTTAMVNGQTPTTPQEKAAAAVNRIAGSKTAPRIGLDLSKLTQQQIDELRKADPEAFKNGTASMSGNSQESSGPQVGFTKNGYRYKGGDPRDKNNWEKV